jgi:DNA-binding transcriptional regulator LsrR (DeoR family)
METVIGEEAARRLAEAFGGRRLYIPKAPGEQHPITVAIGAAAAKVLAAEFGGSAPIDVPMLSTRRARIVELDGLGWSRAKIAREVGVTERRVYSALASLRNQRPRSAGKLT